MSEPPATVPDPPARALGPDATTPDPTGKFAKAAGDLDAIRKSVEDAAAVSAGIWLSYLFVLFYIGIAAGAVTHKNLLLENPVKLPFLSDVPLPLVAFFVLAPIVFIVSHAYTLVHFVMLGAKAGVFHDELFKQLPDAPEARDGLRRQLPSNIFVQFLAGPRDIREGGLGLILKAIAWSSLVVGPVLLLLLIQVQFLPYHLEWVTWVQRLAVFADVILLWLLWPAVLDGRSKLMWHLECRGKGWPGVLALTGRYIAGLIACLIPIGFAFTAATFPGEGMEDWIGKRQTIPPFLTSRLVQKDDKDPVNGEDKQTWTSFHDLLFNGEYDETTQRRTSVFSNTLVLPNFNVLEATKIDDPKNLDAVKQTLILFGRHFENAIFRGADLRKADLENAHLQGASLYQAQLQGAVLYKAHLQGASLYQAKLQVASLEDAQLQGASLEGAELLGAHARAAHLQGASLKGAKLQGADFELSTLDGANLGGAEVWRANLDPASATAVSKDGMKDSPISKYDFAELQATTKEKPQGEELKNALEYIENLNPDIPVNEASRGEPFEKRSVAGKSLADQLKTLACSDEEDALDIVRGLIANDRIKDTGGEAPGLVEAILKPDCLVFAALGDADKAALKEIAKEASGAH